MLIIRPSQVMSMPRGPDSTETVPGGDEGPDHLLLTEDVMDAINDRERPDPEMTGVLIGERASSDHWRATDLTVQSNSSRPPELAEDESYLGLVRWHEGREIQDCHEDADWLSPPFVIVEASRSPVIASSYESTGAPGAPVDVWIPASAGERYGEPPDDTPMMAPTHPATDSTGAPSVEHVDIDQEVTELERVFDDVASEDFVWLENGNVGIEVTYATTDCSVDEFTALIEYIEQYPSLPPRIWVTDPPVDPESNMVHGFDQRGHAQAAYVDLHTWNEQLTGGDAALIMTEWVKHYCAYLDDRHENADEGYLDHIRDYLDQVAGR